MVAITANGLYGERARGLFGMAQVANNGSASSSTSPQAVMERTYNSIAKLASDSVSSNKEMIKLLSQQVRLLGDLKKNSGGGLGITDLLAAKFLGRMAGGLAGGIGKAGAAAGGLAAGVARTVGGGVTKLFTSFKTQLIGGLGAVLTTVGGTVNKLIQPLTSMRTFFSSFSVSGAMGSVWTMAKSLPRVLSVIGRGMTKLFAPLTAAMGIFDGFKGAFDADKILGRQTTMIEKIRTGLAQAVNGMLLGLPDWLSEKAGFKNFAVLNDKIAEASRQMQAKLGQYITDGFNSFTSTVSDGFSRFRTKLTELGDWAKDLLGLGPAITPEQKAKAQASGARLGAMIGAEAQKMNNPSGSPDVKSLQNAQRLDALNSATTPTAVSAVTSTAVSTTTAGVKAIANINKEASEAIADTSKAAEKAIDKKDKGYFDTFKQMMEGTFGAEGIVKRFSGMAEGTLRDYASVGAGLATGTLYNNMNGRNAGIGFKGGGGSSGGAGASASWEPQSVFNTLGKSAGTGMGQAGSSAMTDAKGRVISTASTDMPAHQRAFLDTIAMGNATSGGNYWESPNYNTIVGGKTFNSFADHPRVFGTADSTAAGRYQFTKTTWDDVVKRYNAKNPNSPIKDFSPQNQDKAAYFLAQSDYARRTGGRNLEEDLKNNVPGMGDFIKQGLGGFGNNTTWEILQKKSGNEIGSAYDANFARNKGYETKVDTLKAKTISPGSIDSSLFDPNATKLPQTGNLPDSVLNMRVKASDGSTKSIRDMGITNYADLGKAGQAFAGGYNDPNTTWITSKIQEGLGSNFDRVTAQNDLYHKQNSPFSGHTRGNKTDFTYKGDVDENLAKTRETLTKLGLQEGRDFKLLNEYANPSSKATGGHMDFNLTADGQKRVADLRNAENSGSIATVRAKNANDAITSIFGDNGLNGIRTPGIDKLPDPMKSITDALKGTGEAVGKAITNEVKAPKQPEFIPSTTTNGLQQAATTPMGSTVSKNPTGAPVQPTQTQTPSVRDVPSIDELSMVMANSTMMA